MAHLLRFDLLATGATLLIAVVPAQESRAFPLLVLKAEGKTASFALVTLLFHPTFASSIGGEDIVRATTDANGRACEELIDGAY
ncbi:MAG: hypothetical protein EXS02_05720 [Planctomycetes bacterium]|nr:hypothetical protein [Planctomycetota bacterium]